MCWSYFKHIYRDFQLTSLGGNTTPVSVLHIISIGTISLNSKSHSHYYLTYRSSADEFTPDLWGWLHFEQKFIAKAQIRASRAVRVEELVFVVRNCRKLSASRIFGCAIAAIGRFSFKAEAVLPPYSGSELVGETCLFMNQHFDRKNLTRSISSLGLRMEDPLLHSIFVDERDF